MATTTTTPGPLDGPGVFLGNLIKKQPVILLPLGALLLLALACGRGAASTAPDLQPGDSTRTLTVDGRERSYALHVPPGYDPGQPVPVVLIFHGGGGNAENAIRMTGFNAQADESGFLAVYPNGSGKLEKHLLTWNGGRCCGYAQENDVDDVAFVRALLDDLRTVADIDPKRIYAAGMSNGGIMSYRLACELADQIAAIGPVAGTQNLDICQPSAPVAVIHFHGTDDQHLPYEGGVGAKSLTGVDYASVQESVRFWAAQNGCDETASKEAFDDVTHTVYGSCDQNAMVELYTISGGGHVWPGGQPGRNTADIPTQSISATKLIWEFFAAHPKP